MPILNLYLDDSGTRHPSKKPGRMPAHGFDWFALGGVLVRDEDEGEARRLHAEFVTKWGVSAPLHSSEIRSRNEGFLWLRDKTKEEQTSFYEDLYCLMRDAPVTGIACVIDRPGYNVRYAEKIHRKSLDALQDGLFRHCGTGGEVRDLAGPQASCVA